MKTQKNTPDAQDRAANNKPGRTHELSQRVARAVPKMRFKVRVLPEGEDAPAAEPAGQTAARQRYRRRRDWDDPKVTHRHDVNLKDAHYQSRLEKTTDSRVRAFLDRTKMKKKDFTAAAFNMYLDYRDEKIEQTS